MKVLTIVCHPSTEHDRPALAASVTIPLSRFVLTVKSSFIFLSFREAEQTVRKHGQS
jgi:hypothetical protein